MYQPCRFETQLEEIFCIEGGCHQLIFGLFSFSVMWDLFTTPKVKMLRKSLDTYIQKSRTNK